MRRIEAPAHIAEAVPARTVAVDRLVGAGLVLWAIGAVVTESTVFAGAGLCFLALALREPRAFFRRHSTGLLVWALWSVLAIGTAFASKLSLRTGAPWSALHFGLFPVALLAWRAARPEARRAAVVAAVALLAASAVLAIVQHHHALDYPDWMKALAPVRRVSERSADGGFKSGGLHFHRLKFAHSLVPMLLVLGWLARERLRRPAFAAASLAFTALALVALDHTDTRASWLALGAGVFALAAGRFLAPAWRARAAIAGLAGLSLAPLLFVAIGRGPADRLIAWREAVELFGSQPFAGVGYGRYFETAYAAYGGYHKVFPHIHNDAHTVFLQVVAEGGLAGTAIFLWGLVLFARLAGRCSAAQLALVASLGVLGITHNWPYHPVVTGAVALAFAMADEPAPARSAG